MLMHKIATSAARRSICKIASCLFSYSYGSRTVTAISLFTLLKQKCFFFFWKVGFFPAIQTIALIGWIKAGPPKKPLLL